MRMKRITNLVFVLAITAFSTPALALNCMAEKTETPKLQTLYKAYLESGQLPVGKLLSHQAIGNSGMNVNGIVTGITKYEACWKDKPPCSVDAQYESTNISFITSATEITKVYNGNATIALLECFRKLGLGAQPKKSISDNVADFFR